MNTTEITYRSATIFISPPSMTPEEIEQAITCHPVCRLGRLLDLLLKPLALLSNMLLDRMQRVIDSYEPEMNELHRWEKRLAEISPHVEPFATENDLPIDAEQWPVDYKILFKLTYC